MIPKIGRTILRTIIIASLALDLHSPECMRSARRRQPGQFLHITVRCHHGRFRFLPTKERNEVLGFCLAKAQRKCPGIQVLCVSQIETAELEIATLDEGFAAQVAENVHDRLASLHARQTAVLGMQKVLQQSPFAHPKMSARSRMPLCFAASRETARTFAHGWYAFVAAFREASEKFRNGGLTVRFRNFPSGRTHPPPGPGRLCRGSDRARRLTHRSARRPPASTIAVVAPLTISAPRRDQRDSR